MTKKRKGPDKVDELLDALLAESENPDDLFGQDGLLKQLKKKLVERILDAELTDHLGYEKHAAAGRGSGNSRNGKSTKTLKDDQGALSLEIPRDRAGSFEPQLIRKYQTRWPDFDDQVISLYSRGLSTREIQGHLHELYAVEVSPTLISIITDAVLDEVKAWQNRPLAAVYPIVFLDALFVKIREAGSIRTKAVYLALGINMAGEKELLGLWIEKSEGAKFWLSVLTELQNRGLKDIFILSTDGLSGFPEAIETVYPKAQVQLCIVHLVRNSLNYVSWKQRKEVAADLKTIYRAKTREEAEANLLAFAEKWDPKYPIISRTWQKHWQRLSTFFDYPDDIRKVIYTTNAIESLNHSLRKILKTRGAFPNEEAAMKLLYLALNNISKRWTMPIRDWKAALNRFAILFEDRFPVP